MIIIMIMINGHQQKLLNSILLGNFLFAKQILDEASEKMFVFFKFKVSLCLIMKMQITLWLYTHT